LWQQVRERLQLPYAANSGKILSTAYRTYFPHLAKTQAPHSRGRSTSSVQRNYRSPARPRRSSTPTAPRSAARTRRTKPPTPRPKAQKSSSFTVAKKFLKSKQFNGRPVTAANFAVNMDVFSRKANTEAKEFADWQRAEYNVWNSWEGESNGQKPVKLSDSIPKAVLNKAPKAVQDIINNAPAQVDTSKVDLTKPPDYTCTTLTDIVGQYLSPAPKDRPDHKLSSDDFLRWVAMGVRHVGASVQDS